MSSIKTKDILTAFFGKTLNLPADKVASLFANDEGTEFKPDALDILTKADTDRVAVFKAENKTHFENGQKKATKELMTDFEKSVREKFGVDSEKQGVELIEEIVAAKTKAGELDDAKVTLHPKFLEMEKNLKKAQKDTETQWKTKFEDLEKSHAEEKTFSGVLKKAEDFLKDFALPDDDKLRENQKRLLVDDLKKFKFQQNGDEIIVIDKDGKPLEDGHGNRKGFDNFVKETASNYWPKLEGQQRSGSGGNNNPAGNGKQGSKWGGKVPTNDAEYQAAMTGAKTAEDRIAITDAYDGHRAGRG